MKKGEKKTELRPRYIRGGDTGNLQGILEMGDIGLDTRIVCGLSRRQAESLRVMNRGQ